MFSDRRLATVEEFLRKLSGQEKEPLAVTCDHNYVKPWHAHIDSQRTKPAKMLFMNAIQRPKPTYIYPDEELDVVNVSASENPVPPSLFDSQKTRVLANELERSLKCNLNSNADSSELEDFPIETCSSQKRKIYREVMELINADILAKVVYDGQPHEFIKRKITTERCARELRNIFAGTFYDFDVILWIHRLILDKGNFLSVASYLNILQALSTKIPNIIDKILKAYTGSLSYEYLCQILKKQWDPIVPVLNQHKLRKLPGNPFLVMSCAGLSKSMDKSPRFNFWMTHLNSLCKTMYIPMDCDNKSTFEETLDESILALTNKIIESKNHFPKRPVILAGWNIGALIASHVALETTVDAVICFGFPLTGVNGSRGDFNDPLLDSKVPTLFIIGQNSNMCTTDDIEDFRSRMRVESGLIIVGGSDDLLRISPQKMLLEGITQEIVDRCILDEISEFLHSTVVTLPFSSAFNFKSIMGHNKKVYYSDHHTKRKNRFSEKLSSKKRSKKAVTKELPLDVISTSHASGSSKKFRQNISKKAKDSLVKVQDGRPPIDPLKLKIPKRPKNTNESYYEDNTPPKKPAIPFALNILPKKNDPVDVMKAFGNDSCFLPEQLSAPEPDAHHLDIPETDAPELDTLELDAPKLNAPVSASDLQEILNEFKNGSYFPSHDGNNVIVTPQSIKSPGPPCIKILDSVGLPDSAVCQTLSFASDSKKGISVFADPSEFKAGVKDDKVLASTPIDHLKNICSVKPASSVTQATSTSITKPIITLSSKAATLLLPGQMLKTQSGKFLQLLPKGSVAMKAKNMLSSDLVGSSYSNESPAQKSNLCLLPGTDTVVNANASNLKRVETSSSATLVKLAANPRRNSKQIQILKAPQSHSLSTRVETPEEMHEKRIAIQALSKSLIQETGISENKTNEKSDYSICFAKPDGSVMQRRIFRQPIQTAIRPSHLSSSSKIQHILPNKTS